VNTENEDRARAIESAKGLAELYSAGHITREWFFSLALESYFSPLCDGPFAEMGHIIYRLSDFLLEEERKSILIYPNDDGQILLGSVLWLSLEDWRNEWSLHYPDIPYFQDQLGDVQSLLS